MEKCRYFIRQQDRHTDIAPAGFVNAINAVPIDTLEDFAKVVNEGIDAGQIEGESDLDFDLAEKTISFSFSYASLDFDEVAAFITLCRQINEQAKNQKNNWKWLLIIYSATQKIT